MRRMRRVGLVLIDERRRLVGRFLLPAALHGAARVSIIGVQPRLVTVARDAVRATNSGSSGCSGTNTVPLPPLLTRSRPWSKNWPKKVNIELNGADRPTSGAMFGMGSVPSGSATTSGPATATAAGLRSRLIGDQVADDARLRSETNPCNCSYDVESPASAGRDRPDRSAASQPAAAPSSSCAGTPGPTRQTSSGPAVEMVDRPVDRSQAERQPQVVDLVGTGPEEFPAGRVRLRDLDLAEDESQVSSVKLESRSHGRLRVDDWAE